MRPAILRMVFGTIWANVVTSILLVQELKPLDHLKRRDFGEWAFKSKILFIVEAHFWLSGYNNNQKLQTLSEEILQEIFGVLPYAFKLSFCCAI